MADIWGSTSITVARSDAGVSETRRCEECEKVFTRPKGSDKTHSQVEDVDCAADAGVTDVQKANRWKRR